MEGVRPVLQQVDVGAGALVHEVEIAGLALLGLHGEGVFAIVGSLEAERHAALVAGVEGGVVLAAAAEAEACGVFAEHELVHLGDVAEVDVGAVEWRLLTVAGHLDLEVADSGFVALLGVVEQQGVVVGLALHEEGLHRHDGGVVVLCYDDVLTVASVEGGGADVDLAVASLACEEEVAGLYAIGEGVADEVEAGEVAGLVGAVLERHVTVVVLADQGSAEAEVEVVLAGVEVAAEGAELVEGLAFFFVLAVEPVACGLVVAVEVEGAAGEAVGGIAYGLVVVVEGEDGIGEELPSVVASLVAFAVAGDVLQQGGLQPVVVVAVDELSAVFDDEALGIGVVYAVAGVEDAAVFDDEETVALAGGVGDGLGLDVARDEADTRDVEEVVTVVVGLYEGGEVLAVELPLVDVHVGLLVYIVASDDEAVIADVEVDLPSGTEVAVPAVFGGGEGEDEGVAGVGGGADDVVVGAEVYVAVPQGVAAVGALHHPGHLVGVVGDARWAYHRLYDLFVSLVKGQGDELSFGVDAPVVAVPGAVEDDAVSVVGCVFGREVCRGAAGLAEEGVDDGEEVRVRSGFEGGAE